MRRLLSQSMKVARNDARFLAQVSSRDDAMMMIVQRAICSLGLGHFSLTRDISL
jgi:hypothetical protein